MFAKLEKITDEERDAMSFQQYRAFCHEYERLQSLLWPSSCICAPNRMSPEKRKKQTRRGEVEKELFLISKQEI